MAGCKTDIPIVSSTGRESQLYRDLLNRLGGNHAITMRMYKYAFTDDFFSVFGDWINEPNTIPADQIDENGEPLAEFLFPLSVKKRHSANPDGPSRRLSKYLANTVDGLLSNIISYSTGSFRDIASILRKRATLLANVAVVNVTSGPPARFISDSSGIRIELNQVKLDRLSTDTIEQVILHEIVHGFTGEVLAADPATLSDTEREFADNMRLTFNVAKNSQQVRDNEWLKDHNGFKNVQEFVSEVMTDRYFRDTVQRINNGGIWNSIMRFLKKLFGIKNDLHTAFSDITNYIASTQRSRFNVNLELHFPTTTHQNIRVILDEKERIASAAIRTTEQRINVLHNQPKETGGKRQAQRLRTEKAELQKLLEDGYTDLMLIRFVKNADEEIRNLYKRLADEVNNNTLTLASLVDIYKHSKGFRVVRDVLALSRDDAHIQANFPNIEAFLTETVQILDKIDEVFMREGQEFMVDALLPFEHLAEAEERLRLEREFQEYHQDNYPKGAERNRARVDYINNGINSMSEELESRSRRKLREQFRLGQQDISMYENLFQPIQNASDNLLAIMKELVDRAQDNTRRRHITYRDQLFQHYERLVKHKNNPSDVRVLYDEILERDRDNNYTKHLVSPYYSGFREELTNLIESLSDDPVEQSEAIRQWYEENVEREYTDEFYALVRAILGGEENERVRKLRAKAVAKERWLRDRGELDPDAIRSPEAERTFKELQAIYQEIEYNRDTLTKDQYKEFKKLARISLRTEFSELIGDMQAKRDRGEITQSEYTDWIRGFQVTKQNGGWRWIGTVTKLEPVQPGLYENPDYKGPDTPKKAKWANPQYDALMALGEDNPVVQFYNFAIASQKTFDQRRPAYRQLGFRLPAVRKTEVERVTSGEFTYSSVKEAVLEKFQRRDDDIEFGQVEVSENLEGDIRKFVPLFYTSKDMPVQDQSFDVASLLAINSAMSYNYEEMQNILPQIEAMRVILDEREVVQRNGAGAIFIRRNTNEVRTIPGSQSRTAKLYKEFVNDKVFGERILDERLMGVDTKVWNRMMGYTSTVLLAGNVAASFMNVLFGNVMFTVERMGGNFFGKGTWRKAYKIYMQSLPKTMGDIGRNNPTSFVNRLSEHYDALNEFHGAKYRYAENTWAKKLMKRDSLHGLNNMVEHFNQNLTMIAMLEDTKCMNADGDFIDKNGQPVSSRKKAASLLDFHSLDANNQIVVDERVEQVSIHGKIIPWNQDAEFEITQRIRAINTVLHGAHGQQNKSEVQRHILGRMGLMLRKWFLSGMRHRWRGLPVRFTEIDKNGNRVMRSNVIQLLKGEPLRIQPSQELRQFEQGTYVTTLAWLFRAVRAMREHHFNIIAGIGAGVREGMSDWHRLTMYERGNIIKTFTEIGFWVTSSILAGILESIASEADDETEEWWYFLAYQAYRLRTELRAYSSGQEFFRLFQDPSPILSMAEDVFTLTSQAWGDAGNIIQGEGAQRYVQGRRRGQLRIRKPIEQLVPFYRHVDRLANMQEALTYFGFRR